MVHAPECPVICKLRLLINTKNSFEIPLMPLAWEGFFLAFLVLAFKSFDAFCADGSVFGPSAFDPFAPHVKGAALHVFAHDGSHLIFFDAVLHLNGFERRSIFPSHFDDAIHGFCIQISWRLVLQVFGVKREHVLKTAQRQRCFILGKVRWGY